MHSSVKFAWTIDHLILQCMQMADQCCERVIFYEKFTERVSKGCSLTMIKLVTRKLIVSPIYKQLHPSSFCLSHGSPLGIARNVNTERIRVLDNCITSVIMSLNEQTLTLNKPL